MEANRRSFVAGALAACLLAGKPGIAASGAASGTRRFDLYRAGSRIGTKSVDVSRSGSQVTVEIEIDIVGRVVGVPVYRYALSSRELWDRGALVMLDAKTNDNGSRQFASAKRGPGGLQITGSGFSGLVGGNPGTTTYWSSAFLKRPVWISTQDGRPLMVAPRRGAVETFETSSAAVRATRWNVRGELKDLDLFYDDAGEWVGSEFPARGETARFAFVDGGAALKSLWVDAS